MSVLIKKFADHLSMPWLNGRGASLEIASDRGLNDAWTWRLAMAPVVADGPFSKLDGVDRQLIVVDGRGMALTIDRKVFECKPLEVVSFRGEAVTSVRLNHGPIRDLNLMTRRGSCSGSLVVLRRDSDLQESSGALDTEVLGKIVVAVESTTFLLESERINLEFGDAVLLEPQDNLTFVSGTAIAATIRGELL